MRRSHTVRTVSPILILVVCVALAGGCFSTRDPQRNRQVFQEVSTDQDFPVFDELSLGQTSIVRPLRLVIYDFASLSQFPLLNLNVDFKTQMVLLAAMGPASSEQCAIEITGAWRDGDRVRVEIQEFYPDADSPHRPGIVSPLHAIVVPRCELPIEGFTSRIPVNAFRR